MWQILLTFISISFVSCDTICAAFKNYQNLPELEQELSGEYMIVYTSSSYLLDCERIFWTGPSNNRTAYLSDAAGCCRRIDNFDNSNPNYFEHDITPTNSVCPRLLSKERVSKKLVASTGTGADICLISYVCHPSRSGLLVACRKEPNLWLWVQIGNILASLLNLLLVPVPILKTVNQYKCIFDQTCVV